MARSSAQLRSETRTFRAEVLSASRYHFLLRPFRLLLYATVPFIVGRFLSPVDYGRVAVSLSVVGLVDLFSLPGVNSYLLRYPEPEKDSSFFWLVVGARALIFGLVYVFAAEIGKASGISGIAPYLRFLSVVMVISRTGYVPNVLLTRELRYGVHLFNSLFSETGSIVALLVCFWLGMKEWSVLVRYAVMTITPAILCLFFAKWLPRPEFKWSHVKSVFPFSRNIFLCAVTDQWLGFIEALLFGRLFGSAFAGMFAMALKLATLVLQNLIGPADWLFLSLATRLKPSPERVRSLYYSFLQTTMFLTFPTMILIVFSAPYVPLVLGNQWKEIYHLMLPLCFAAGISAISPPSALYVLMEATLLQSVLGFIRLILGIGGVLVGAYWGENGALLGIAIGTTLGTVMETYVMIQRFRFPKMEYVRKTLSLYVASFLLASYLWVFRHYFSTEGSLGLVGRDLGFALVGLFLYLYYFSATQHPSMIFVQRFFFSREREVSSQGGSS